MEDLVTLTSTWALRIVAAVLILVIGWWFAGKVRDILRDRLTKRQVDAALVGFLGSILYYAVLAAVVISAIGQVGIKTTSFVAVLGAAGLAIGLALQGSLSNFAAGTLLMLFRPFRAGDFVEAGGTSGIVEEIGVLMVQMRSPDNKRIYVPNSQIMSKVITNVTVNPRRRIDLDISIAYHDDIDQAKAIINEVLNEHPKVLKDPAPTVELWELGESSLNLIVRPWAEKADWFPTRCEILPEIKRRLEAAGMTIPFPQRDVHLYQHADAEKLKG